MENKREKNLYLNLPILIREIILQSALPLPTDKAQVLREIEEIKLVTNAECESALAYLEKYNGAFME